MNVTMPDFITKALTFFERAEPHLTAQTELITTREKLIHAEADLATARQSIESFGKQIEAKDASLKTLADEHAAALAAKETEVEKRASLKAHEITAAQGQAPLAKASTPASTPESMKRVDFEKLSPVAQKKHLQAGGKVID